MNTLFEHRSIRKFTSQEIPEAVFNTIIEGAARASNTGNMQIYSIVATTDQATKTELCKRGHFGQPSIEQAPLVLTFCADLNRFTKWCNVRNAEPGYDNFLSLYTATVDATIAAQNACIAAEDEGLGICYFGTTNYCADDIIDVLNLPSLVVPVTTIAIGYPDEKPSKTDRLPHRAILHKETYQDFSDSEINELYAEKEALPEYKGYVEEHNLDNLAQVFTKKRYTTENNITISKTLLETLKKQGFMNND
ncbi:MAG: nitroreductase family protein [Bacteroidales bacterium]